LASLLAGSSFFMSEEGVLGAGAALPEDGALLDDEVEPVELAGGVDGVEVAGGVEAVGAVDLEADLDASSPQAASATAAAAISSTFFIGQVPFGR